MDCSTARLFLQLGPPGASRDLGPEEAEELKHHLGDCAACHQLDIDQRRLDAALGKAMCDVKVPTGLKEQVLLRLAAEQGARERRWGGRVFLAVASAAASFLVCWAAWALWAPLRPTITGEEVVRDYNIVRPDRDAANAQLRQLGLPACAPDLNYAYLTGAPSRAVLPGTEDWKRPVEVAQFVFAHNGQQAIVYAVPHKEAKVERPESSDQGYTYSLHYADGTDGKYVCLILHTGKSWEWLKAPGAE